MVTDTTVSTVTKNLNLREIPLPIYTQLKVFAAASNMGIREYCVSIFEAHIQQQAQQVRQGIGLTLVPASAASTPETPAAKKSK